MTGITGTGTAGTTVVYYFEIKGEPKPKGRPKFCRRGKFTTSYTPKPTREAEQDIRSQIIAQLDKDWVPIKGAVCLTADFRRCKPKSASKKVKHPTTRPDLDNYLKLLLDAMNTVVFVDDSQIIYLKISKSFSDVPGISIIIEEHL